MQNIFCVSIDLQMCRFSYQLLYCTLWLWNPISCVFVYAYMEIEYNVIESVWYKTKKTCTKHLKNQYLFRIQTHNKYLFAYTHTHTHYEWNEISREFKRKPILFYWKWVPCLAPITVSIKNCMDYICVSVCFFFWMCDAQNEIRTCTLIEMCYGNTWLAQPYSKWIIILKPKCLICVSLLCTWIDRERMKEKAKKEIYWAEKSRKRHAKQWMIVRRCKNCMNAMKTFYTY